MNLRAEYGAILTSWIVSSIGHSLYHAMYVMQPLWNIKSGVNFIELLVLFYQSLVYVKFCEKVGIAS